MLTLIIGLSSKLINATIAFSKFRHQLSSCGTNPASHAGRFSPWQPLFTFTLLTEVATANCWQMLSQGTKCLIDSVELRRKHCQHEKQLMLKKPKVSGNADGPKHEAEGGIRITAPSCANGASIVHHHVPGRVRLDIHVSSITCWAHQHVIDETTTDRLDWSSATCFIWYAHFFFSFNFNFLHPWTNSSCIYCTFQGQPWQHLEF